MTKHDGLYVSHNPIADMEVSTYQGLEERILHIYHKEWWGIRSATELLPGWKLGISSTEKVDHEDIFSFINTSGFEHILFQGYSENASNLAEFLFKKGRGNFTISVVTHVSAAQFDHQFEIDMMSTMIQQKKRGVLASLLSVKAGFHEVCSEFEKLLIVNNMPRPNFSRADRNISSALIPLTRGLRKNMQVNHIAFCLSSYETIFSTVHDAELGLIVDDKKVCYLGHVPQNIVQKFMSRVGLVSNVTLIECQPMVLNEAVALGTPCLTGPLYLPFCDDHPIRALTEIRQPDNIALIRERAENIKAIWIEDPDYFPSLCEDYHRKVTILSAESYSQAFDKWQ